MNTRLLTSLGPLVVATFAAIPAAYAEEPISDDPRVDDVDAPDPKRAGDIERTAKNAIYGELGGNALFYSVNYDRALTNDITARVGFGYFSIGASSGDASASASVTTIPVMVNYLLGGGDHNFEIGAGALLVVASAEASDSDSAVAADGFGAGGTATAGYRYQPRDGGFLFRAGFTPLITRAGFTPWAGISLGGAF